MARSPPRPGKHPLVHAIPGSLKYRRISRAFPTHPVTHRLFLRAASLTLPAALQENKSGNIIHFTTIASSVGLGIGKQRHAYAAGKAAAAVLTKRIGVENAKAALSPSRHP